MHQTVDKETETTDKRTLAEALGDVAETIMKLKNESRVREMAYETAEAIYSTSFHLFYNHPDMPVKEIVEKATNFVTEISEWKDTKLKELKIQFPRKNPVSEETE